jgi:RNA polymerase sigma-70 factor (ECF subfamily)
MKAAIGGNPKRARFQALCQSLRPDLLRFAFWLSRDRALAEDVVQEALLRAWKAQDSLLDEAAAKPWLLTIIRREYARSFERKRFVTVNVDELIAKEEPQLAAADDHDVQELRAALFKLPDEYREPLVLQVLMGYSTAEIAAELALSNAAVLTRLFRARQQLRRLCGEDTRLDPEEPRTEPRAVEPQPTKPKTAEPQQLAEPNPAKPQLTEPKPADPQRAQPQP